MKMIVLYCFFFMISCEKADIRASSNLTEEEAAADKEADKENEDLTSEDAAQSPNDLPVTLYTLSTNETSFDVVEGADLVIPVSLGAVAEKPLTIQWSLTGSTTDFPSESGVIEVPVGLESASLTLSPSENDRIEAGRVFTVSFSGDPAIVTNTHDVTVNISDNDSAIRLVIVPPTDGLVGQDVPVTIQAQDLYGTIDPNFNGSVTLSLSGSATGGGVLALVNGAITTNVSTNLNELVNITLSDSSVSGINLTSAEDINFLIDDLLPDGSSYSLQATLLGARGDYGAAISPDGSRIAVGDYANNSFEGRVAFYTDADNFATPSVLTPPQAPEFGNPWFGSSSKFDKNNFLYIGSGEFAAREDDQTGGDPLYSKNGAIFKYDQSAMYLGEKAHQNSAWNSVGKNVSVSHDGSLIVTNKSAQFGTPKGMRIHSSDFTNYTFIDKTDLLSEVEIEAIPDGSGIIVGDISSDTFQYYHNNMGAWEVKETFTDDDVSIDQVGRNIGISMDGNILVSSANAACKIYVFKREAGSYSQYTTIDPTPHLDGCGSTSQSHSAVSAYGNIVAVSFPNIKNDAADPVPGTTLVFRKNGDSYEFFQALVSPGAVSNAGISFDIADDGKTIITGNTGGTMVFKLQ